MSEGDNSTMMIVVLGIAGMCCSSVAGLGFAWYNNYLCDCCSLCRTEGTTGDPGPAPPPAPGPVVLSPEGPPSPDGDTGDDDDDDDGGSNDKNNDNTVSNKKLPQTIFTTNGNVKYPRVGFYIVSGHGSCKKMLVAAYKAFTAYYKKPVQALECVKGDLGRFGPLFMFEIVKEDRSYIIRVRGDQAVRLGVSKDGSSYQLMLTSTKYAIKNVNSRWSIIPYNDDTVYLKNGYGVYLAVDSCLSGKIKFESKKTSSNDQRCRWKMVLQRPTC